MTVSDNTFNLLFSFSLSHLTFSQLKLLPLSNLTVSPSECPADKEKMEKTHGTPKTCFAFIKHCISFDYLHNTKQRNISMFGCLWRAVHEVICLHISAHSAFRVRNPRQNYIIELINCFDLVSDYGSHITKSYKLARKWTMFTDSYLLSVTLSDWSTHSKFMLQLLRVDSADTSTFVTGKSATENEMRPEENSHA